MPNTTSPEGSSGTIIELGLSTNPFSPAFTATSESLADAHTPTTLEDVAEDTSTATLPIPEPTPQVIPVTKEHNDDVDTSRPQLANATLLMLARNSEVDTAANSVRELEDKFNKQFGYPWVFLNEVEFSDEFKQ